MNRSINLAAKQNDCPTFLKQLISNRSLILGRSVALFFAIALTSTIANAQFGERPFDQASTEDSNAEITRAREKAKTAKKKYETVKRLRQRGSASQKELRDAELLKRIAVLEYSNFVSPELEQENTLIRANLVFNYRSKELSVIKSLYQRGSASQLEYQRAKTARDVARSRLQAVKSVSESQRKIQIVKAANSKFDAAQKEHQLAAKLLQSGSISQSVMDRAASNLEIARSELSEAKKSLGAKAVQVQQ